MKVVEKVRDLKDKIEAIEDWYCANCQEQDCSLCPYEYEVCPAIVRYYGEQDG